MSDALERGERVVSEGVHVRRDLVGGGVGLRDRDWEGGVRVAVGGENVQV